jgi:hypothetical protein
MPDLTQGPSSYIGNNYRRALDNFSRFGTRRLALYTIWIYNVADPEDSLFTDEQLYNGPDLGPGFGSDVFPPEWIEAPGNILEAVYRGVQMVAEPYYFGDWDTNGGDYPGATDVVLTVVVAADTFQDGYEQNHTSPVPQNPNSYTLESAIADALVNFDYSGVYVQQAILRGDYVDEFGGDALPMGRKNPANATRRQAVKAARIAAGKTAYKRQG